ASGKEGVALLPTEIEADNAEISVAKNQRGVVDTLPSSGLPLSGSPAKALPNARPPDPSELPRDPPKP
ncbi:hypothetical protein A2U01_0118388, partial [Trifolium medium]|nr:hypothetical protein [Trifolium medium]